ncbi:MAG TPA: RagB/SusD family nutrient uptake outer membrane protein [Parafilimonas sp.]|nr:RagB/SusD family nutrient uptake outer membrane protein [Parafilimonas sp.]
MENKKTKNIISILLLAGCVVFLMLSCKKLDPTVYSEILPEDFFKTEEQIIAFTSSGYANVAGYFNNIVLEIGVTSDEFSNPLRSNDGWGTNDDQMAHNFKANEGYPTGAWNSAFGGAATCNRLIEFLQNLTTDQTSAISELRALRAFYLWEALDLFGNIPVELRFETADPAPSQIDPAQAFQIIEKEILEALPDLSPGKSQATYAKMNQATAKMVLAEMYINAERFGIASKWAEAAAVTKSIIDNGDYSLSPGYFSNFFINNETSSENIFVIPFERNKIDNSFVHSTLHQSADKTFGLAAQPWGGYTIKSDFYNSFDSDDARRGMFIVGQQYTKDAGPQWDAVLGFKYSNPQDQYKLYNWSEDYNVLTNVERQFWNLPTLAAGQTYEDLSPQDQEKAGSIVIDPNAIPIPRTVSGRGEDMIKYRDEARMGKFEIEVGTNVGTGSNNDFPIYRYAETLLIRAEALWRTDHGNAEALNLVNQIRSRARLDPLTQLTEDALYHEIKHELALEGKARPVLIRFGHWEDEWNWKYIDPDKPGDPYVRATYKRWFPIPESALNTNTNLKQNPGY